MLPADGPRPRSRRTAFRSPLKVLLQIAEQVGLPAAGARAVLEQRTEALRSS